MSRWGPPAPFSGCWARWACCSTAIGRCSDRSVYLLSGIAGVLLSLTFSSNVSVGASGAIFGLLGALGVLLYRNRPVFRSERVPALRHRRRLAQPDLQFECLGGGLRRHFRAAGRAGRAALPQSAGVQIGACTCSPASPASCSA